MTPEKQRQKLAEREAARLRMAARRQTPEYREWLERSRESRAALKRKYRAQAAKHDGHIVAHREWQKTQTKAARKLQAKAHKEQAQEFFRLMGMKLCPGCDAMQRTKDFCSDRSRPDGFNRMCRSCDTKRTLERRQGDPVLRLRHNIANRIRAALMKGGAAKCSATEEIVGCSLEELRHHIEKQFTRGMTWELVGRDIHIDHIVPLASATTAAEVLRLNHFTNLRPLWAVDNLRKGGRRVHLL